MEELLKQFNPIKILDYIKDNIFHVLPAFLLIMLYSPIKRYIKYILNRFYVRIFKENHGVISFLNSFTGFVIDVFLIFNILHLFGINLSGIMAIMGALSLVFGFAFKDTLSNIFGGIIILLFKPFVIGDAISIGQSQGTVTKIDIFYTHILSFNNEEIIIPNANIINTEIKNITAHDYRRLDIVIGVGYSSNIKEVKDLINEIVERRRNDLFALDFSPLVVGMKEIGASSLNFEIKVHVTKGNYVSARYYLNESIKEEFDKAGIDLPYNIIDLQINKDFNDLNIKDTNGN